MYNGENKSVAEMMKMIVCIAPKAISDSEKREKVLFLAMLIANKFIPEQEFNKIWEVQAIEKESFDSL